MAENGPFGTPFLTPKIPRKCLCGSLFLRSFPGNEAHKLFLGAQNGGFRVGCKKFMLKKFMCFFGPLFLPESPSRPGGAAHDLNSSVLICLFLSERRKGLVLVAPYCAIPRDYLSDTRLLRAMGFLVSQHGQLGAIPPPPCEVEVRYPPPPQKEYLSDSGAIPFENKANGCDTPLCDTISKGYCTIWAGISLWAAKGVVLSFLRACLMLCWHVFCHGCLLHWTTLCTKRSSCYGASARTISFVSLASSHDLVEAVLEFAVYT